MIYKLTKKRSIISQKPKSCVLTSILYVERCHLTSGALQRY